LSFVLRCTVLYCNFIVLYYIVHYFTIRMVYLWIVLSGISCFYKTYSTDWNNCRLYFDAACYKRLLLSTFKHMSTLIILLFMFSCYVDSYLYTKQIIHLRGNRPQDKQYMVKIDVHYNFFAFFWVILIKTCRKFLHLASDIIERFSPLFRVDLNTLLVKGGVYSLI